MAPSTPKRTHVEGLFAREEWLRMLSDAGFAARCVPFDLRLPEADVR
jgi:hypothetical protein